MESHGPSRFPLRHLRASSGWVERLARELETAVGADRRPHPKPLVIDLDAALDVREIVLEGADLDGELVAEIVEGPLVLSKEADDLLASGAERAHGSPVVTETGGCSGPPWRRRPTRSATPGRSPIEHPVEHEPGKLIEEPAEGSVAHARLRSVYQHDRTRQTRHRPRDVGATISQPPS